MDVFSFIVFCLERFLLTDSVDPYLRNPRRDISFPIFTRKEVETKRIGKRNQNSNNSFKRLIIFPFQYRAEQKLKQEN